MNQEYIFYLRKKLETRIDRLHRADHQMFDHVLKQFWFFLNQTPIFASLILGLNCSDTNRQYTDKVNNFYNELDLYYFELSKNFNLYEVSEYNEKKYITLCYLIICKCCKSDFIGKDKPATIGMLINSKCNGNDEGLNKFKQEIIHPLYQYIDEQLDEQKLTIDLIRRYKQKSEWFNRQKLHNIWKDNSSKGEKLLALDLYEYLFDCGLEFDIEPWSINGEPDLVVAQKSDPLIADAKIFKGDKNYIVKGFNQVYIYTLTYNQPFGYLIIYKTCEKDLRFSLNNQTQSTQFVTCNNKTIFITVIDIFNYETTASKRKPVKPIEITEQDLINGLDRDDKLDES